MSGSASVPAGERLLRELAGAIDPRSACIPEPVRREYPALEPVAHELGLETTSSPAGGEDVMCLLAVEPGSGTVPRLDSALERFPDPPFLLVCGPSAPAEAQRLQAGPGDWLARSAPAGDDAALIAPAARVLDAPGLAGEWHAGRPAGDPLATDREALDALWLAVERDRETLAALSERADHDARRLDEARRARERLSAEVARLRAAERHELDRMRLALLEQRAWVADQAQRVATSTSWRLGHRLVRIGRTLAFKRDRGTNLPARIAERMRDGEL